MYRMTTNRSMGSRQRCDERILSRRNLSGSSCGLCNDATPIAEMPSNYNGCGNYHSDSFDYSLAMVYPPEQIWQNLYCEEEGFFAGTIFKELDKPFYGHKCHGGVCNE